MADISDEPTRRYGNTTAVYALGENVALLACDLATRLRTSPKLEILLGSVRRP